MKKSFNKLSLNKSTISNLNNSDLGQIVGGVKSNACLPNTFTCAAGPCGAVSHWCTIKK